MFPLNQQKNLKELTAANFARQTGACKKVKKSKWLAYYASGISRIRRTKLLNWIWTFVGRQMLIGLCIPDWELHFLKRTKIIIVLWFCDWSMNLLLHYDFFIGPKIFTGLWIFSWTVNFWLDYEFYEGKKRSDWGNASRCAVVDDFPNFRWDLEGRGGFCILHK